MLDYMERRYMLTRVWLVLVLAAVFVGLSPSCNSATIENETIKVAWNPSSKCISLHHIPSGVEFVSQVVLLVESEGAEVVAIRDKVFGNGNALSFKHPDGRLSQVLVFDDFPFALIRGTLHHSGSKEKIVANVPFPAFTIAEGLASKELITMGTGGLLSIDENPGSYAWLATVEPKSRNGVVAGWLTHDRGSGVLFSRIAEETVTIEGRIDYGRLLIPANGDVPLETFAVGYFEDARLGLEAWADAVARVYDVRLPSQPTGYCTWYSKPHGGASDERHLAELSSFAADCLQPAGFSVVQIDDKWQAGESTNGPRRNFTSHDPEGPYPDGMKAAADMIKGLGLTPGIWFMPFAGTSYDPFFADHQDWFVRSEDGLPYETKWGGTCLDMTHPGAREHLRSVVDRIVAGWGYEYLKIDGLWTGTATPLRYVNSGYVEDGIGDAVFHDPATTNIEAFRSGLQLVRETAGPNVFILGCNGPQNMRSYGGAMGLVDAMRVGPDNGPQWKQLLRGPLFGSRHYFLHGRVWYNDPDPVYVRPSMPLNHAQLICSWAAVSGQLNLSSEWLPGLPAERLEILKRTMPSHGLLPRPVDYFESDLPRLWTVVDERRQPHRTIVAAFNWDVQSQDNDVTLARLGLNPHTEYAAYDYWQDKFLPRLLDSTSFTVPGESCQILAVRPVSDAPQLLSTSRHVTQGIVDVSKEEWSDSARTLSGISQIIGGDDYELRIVLPNAQWKVKAVRVANSHGIAVESALRQEGLLLRVHTTPATSGEMTWEVEFE
jgi:hypothetical protein